MNLNSIHFIELLKTVIGRNCSIVGRLGYALLSGISLAIIDLGVNNLIIVGFHQSFNISNVLVYLNHRSLNPSSVTALFLDIYFYIQITCYILIGGREGKFSDSGGFLLLFPEIRVRQFSQFY